MPLTPFHLGPGIFFGTLFYRFFNLAAFLIASVILDLEPFYKVFIVGAYPWHGFFHTYSGSAVAALLLAVLMYGFRNKIKNILNRVNLGQTSSFLSIFFAALSGAWLHVTFDSLLHFDANPFWPFSDSNPLLGLFSTKEVYASTAVLGATGIILLFLKMRGKAAVK